MTEWERGRDGAAGGKRRKGRPWACREGRVEHNGRRALERPAAERLQQRAVAVEDLPEAADARLQRRRRASPAALIVVATFKETSSAVL